MRLYWASAGLGPLRYLLGTLHEVRHSQTCSAAAIPSSKREHTDALAEYCILLLGCVHARTWRHVDYVGLP
jgi:hypothetical protein